MKSATYPVVNAANPSSPAGINALRSPVFRSAYQSHNSSVRQRNTKLVEPLIATEWAVVEATVAAETPTGARRARVAAGNLGVAATGISAGIQLWSRPGGVLAGGATMTGTVTDGAEVDVIGEAEFLGQKYYQIRDSSKEGWVDGRFLQLD